MSWETVIGLEVHVQLKTKSKMFCGCSTEFGASPNTNVCPVCLGLPGSLPVTNRRAVELAVRGALGLGFHVNDVSVFARKNYFYPDLPKGYQISQFDKPLANQNGSLEIISPERGAVSIGVTRLHLEEDAGKSFHDRIPGKTAVDFNRAGVPLCEIVSEPDMRSPGEARAYLVGLKQVLEYLDVSDCDMEKGSLRVDANLSVRHSGATKLGTKWEAKNMNSFSGVEKALVQMRDEQIRRLEKGEGIVLTTFGSAGVVRVEMPVGGPFTVAGPVPKSAVVAAQRTKEQSHDYRYFPEPDLPPLVLSKAGVDVGGIRRDLPELPAEKRARFIKEYGLSEYDAGVLAATAELGVYFEQVASLGADPKAAANWVMGSVLQDSNEHSGLFRVAPKVLAGVIALVAKGIVSSTAAKQVFVELANNGGNDPKSVAERLGLVQVGDADQIGAWVNAVVAERADEAKRYRGGEVKLLGFFVGEVMKRSKGKADPKAVQAKVKEMLG